VKIDEAETKQRLETIGKVYEQQRFMQRYGNHSCPVRIVSLRQPHIAASCRGQSGQTLRIRSEAAPVGGQWVYIHRRTIIDNYNEGVRLQASSERYKDRFGHFLKAILADTFTETVKTEPSARNTASACPVRNLAGQGRMELTKTTLRPIRTAVIAIW
jgi:hypothetical protein